MNDVLDAINNRIKSPYFGYAILSFIALNWRGIFLLLVTEGDPSVRLDAFDSETNYWTLVVLPLVAGAIVAASTEWLRYFFLIVSEKPLELIENSNLEAEHKKAIRHTELEQSRSELAATQEQELIGRAKRDEKISKIEDESKKKELVEQIDKLRKKRDSGLSDIAEELLLAAASDSSGTIMKPSTIGKQGIQAGKKSFGSESKRAYAECEAALGELVAEGYVKEVGLKGELFELTHLGWQLADAS